MKPRLCRLFHWIGITFCMWSMRLQGDGPGPWPQEEPDFSNVLWIEERR